jgi:endonuclease/exonuclease/phosphatase family metal-dependent hydrolase
MATIRLATFNVENLFDRARVLNLRDNAQGDKAISVIRDLETELSKTAYDKAKILQLYKSVSKYVEVVEVREKLFKRKLNTIVGVAADGVDDWQGWIEFKRDDFTDAAPENTARVLREINADVVCLVEVEDRLVLSRFASQKLTKSGGFRPYPFNILIDGNDPRGIDVSLLSRFPIRQIRSHIDDRSGGPTSGGGGRVFSRDCLEVDVELPGGRTLHMLLNHLKSRGYGTTAANDARRKLQADTVAKKILPRYDLKKDLVVVCGDFNDTPDRPPLQTLLQTPNLSDVLSMKFPTQADRWTYFYKKPAQIDYLLVSDPLKQVWKDAGVERRGIHDLKTVTHGTEQSFPTVTSPTSSASDHGAVWAEFSI